MPAAMRRERGRPAALARMALAWAALLPPIALVPAAAQAQSRFSEHEVKAAVLLNLLRFVEWPDSSFADGSDPIIVAVAGDDPFGPILERTFEGQLVHGHELVIRRFSRPQRIDFCHVLFVAAGEDSQAWLKVLSLSQVGGALTVGEEEPFLGNGGAVMLRLDDRRVRFDVNLEAARAAGLTISSRLLSLAQVRGSR
jgi:hypothetical protein